MTAETVTNQQILDALQELRRSTLGTLDALERRVARLEGNDRQSAVQS